MNINHNPYHSGNSSLSYSNRSLGFTFSNTFGIDGWQEFLGSKLQVVVKLMCKMMS